MLKQHQRKQRTIARLVAGPKKQKLKQTPEVVKQLRKPKQALEVPRRAFTVTEFCLAHRISRSTFYNLKAAGRAPDTLQVTDDGRVLITEEAAARWRAKYTVVTK